jgi:hypothetical protein
VFEAEYGAIEVAAGDGSAIGLEVVRKVEADSKAEADGIFQDLEISQTGDAGNVRIQTRFRAGWKDRSELRDGRRRMCHDGKCLEYAGQLREYRFRLTVPREHNVELATRAGSVTVADLKGAVRSRTSGGSLTFGRIGGPVWGSTSGGSIRLQEVTGPADVKTSGGSITIERARGSVTARTSGGSINVREAAGPVDARTSGGSVRAALTQRPSAPSTFATSGGSITVSLPPDAAVDVDATTSGGRVSTEFPVTGAGELRRNQLKAKINGGGPALTLRTSGGSIRLQKSTI